MEELLQHFPQDGSLLPFKDKLDAIGLSLGYKTNKLRDLLKEATQKGLIVSYAKGGMYYYGLADRGYKPESDYKKVIDRAKILSYLPSTKAEIMWRASRDNFYCSNPILNSELSYLQENSVVALNKETGVYSLMDRASRVGNSPVIHKLISSLLPNTAQGIVDSFSSIGYETNLDYISSALECMQNEGLITCAPVPSIDGKAIYGKKGDVTITVTGEFKESVSSICDFSKCYQTIDELKAKVLDAIEEYVEFSVIIG